MREFTFDLGNSTSGAIGMVVRVRAETPEDALAKLQEALPEELEIFPQRDRDIEAVVFFNPGAVTAGDAEVEDE